MIWYFAGLIVLITIFIIFINNGRYEDLVADYQYNNKDLVNDEETLHSILQDYRAQEILIDKFACDIISDHVDFMVQYGKPTHQWFNERSSKLQNKGATYVSEIISYGNKTPEKAFRAFLSSEYHKKILDDERFNICGISIKKDDSGRKYYAIIMFKG
jgi:hypothetical protein